MGKFKRRYRFRCDDFPCRALTISCDEGNKNNIYSIDFYLFTHIFDGCSFYSFVDEFSSSIIHSGSVVVVAAAAGWVSIELCVVCVCKFQSGSFHSQMSKKTNWHLKFAYR